MQIEKMSFTKKQITRVAAILMTAAALTPAVSLADMPTPTGAISIGSTGQSYQTRAVATAINVYAKSGTVPHVKKSSGTFAGANGNVTYNVLEIKPDGNTIVKVDYAGNTPKIITNMLDTSLTGNGYYAVGGINAGFFDNTNTNKTYGLPTGVVEKSSTTQIFTDKNSSVHYLTPAGYGSGFTSLYFDGTNMTNRIHLRYHGWTGGVFKYDSDNYGEDTVAQYYYNTETDQGYKYVYDYSNGVAGAYTLFVNGENKTLGRADSSYWTWGSSVTLFGQKADGTYLLVTTTGNIGDGSYESALMGQLGATDAVRFDGGGSTNMFYDDGLVNWAEVKVNPENGDATYSLAVKDGNTVSVPADPSKTYYTFDGWYTSEAAAASKDSSAKYDFSTKLNSDISLYAGYTGTPVSYTAYVEGTSYKTGTVLMGSSITDLTDPTPAAGKKFDGWYSDSAYTTKVDMTQPVTGALALYGRYVDLPTYTVTFNSNGGTDVTAETIYEGSAASQPTDPTRNNYNFKGWYTDENLSTAYDFTTAVTADTTLYAKWKGITINVYYSNTDSTITGTLPAMQYGEYNTQIQIGANAMAKSDVTSASAVHFDPNHDGAAASDASVTETTSYTGNGWNTSADGSGTYYADNALITLAGDITLHPVMKSADSYSNVALPSISRTGYDFLGWYDAAQDGSKIGDAGTIVKGSTALAAGTYYAHWSPIMYEVTFESNGGSSVSSQSIQSGNTISQPADPTKAGYLFAGWYQDSALKTAWNFSTDKVSSATTLYAKWKENDHIISFESNGGSAVDSITVMDGQLLSAPTNPEKTGYYFNGWFTDTELQNPFNFTKAVTADATLYAAWEAKTYTITFNSNGGSTIDSVKAAYGTAASKPADPTYDGHVFKGWFTDTVLTSAYDFSTLVTGDKTLYAKWVNSSYTVSFQSNGGSSVADETVALDALVTAPADPTKDNYNFVGWYKDSTLNTPWNFASDTIDADVTLYAKWTAVPTVSVTFNSNGGSAVDIQTVPQNGLVSKPEDPTLEDYSFGGWYSDEALTAAWNFTNENVSSDMTLYAKWTRIQYDVTFVTNAGSSIDAVKVNSGDVIGTETTTREHYTFAGWFGDEALTSAFDTEKTPVKSALTLYAKWTPDTYHIYYRNDDSTVKGTLPADMSGAYQTEAAVSDNAMTKDVSSVARSIQIDLNYTSSQGISKTDPITYKVNTAYTADGWLNAAEKVANGTELKYLQDITLNPNFSFSTSAESFVFPDATRDGYFLSAWSTTSDGKNILGTPGGSYQPGSEEIIPTLYAVWTKGVTVTFDSNGGSAVAAQSVPTGASAARPEDPARSGYIFTGWFTEKDGSTSFDFALPVSQDTTVYAGWKSDNMDITVSYHDANTTEPQDLSGKSVTVSVPKGTSTPLDLSSSLASVKALGYVIDAATVPASADGTTASYIITVTHGTAQTTMDVSGSETSLTRTIQYVYSDDSSKNTSSVQTASYSLKETSTTDSVTGTVLGKVQNAVWDSGIDSWPEASVPAVTGYTADKAKVSAVSFAGMSVTQLAAQTKAVTETVTYSKNPTPFSVTLYVDGKEYTVVSGDSSNVPALPVPTKTGFTFNGWYTDAACTRKLAGEFQQYSALYGNWSDNKNAVINVHLYGGSEGSSTALNGTVVLLDFTGKMVVAKNATSAGTVSFTSLNHTSYQVQIESLLDGTYAADTGLKAADVSSADSADVSIYSAKKTAVTISFLDQDSNPQDLSSYSTVVYTSKGTDLPIDLSAAVKKLTDLHYVIDSTTVPASVDGTETSVVIPVTHAKQKKSASKPHNVVRTIQYIVSDDASKGSIVTQNGSFFVEDGNILDLVTNQLTDISTVTTEKGWDAVTVPAMTGYTPDKTTIAAVASFAADATDETVKVTYTKDTTVGTREVVARFRDTDTAAPQDLSAYDATYTVKTDGTSVKTNLADAAALLKKKGFLIDSSLPDTYTVSDAGIHVYDVHHGRTDKSSTEQLTFTRSIVYAFSDNSSKNTTTKQTVTVKKTTVTTTDDVTGKTLKNSISYSWPNGSAWERVVVPSLTGYKKSLDVIESYDLSTASSSDWKDQTIIVNYTKTSASSTATAAPAATASTASGTKTSSSTTAVKPTASSSAKTTHSTAASAKPSASPSASSSASSASNQSGTFSASAKPTASSAANTSAASTSLTATASPAAAAKTPMENLLFWILIGGLGILTIAIIVILILKKKQADDDE
jgi:uncharacterized repeat protein (TIGR02543 family)